MEQIQKYVDQILDTIGRAQIVRYVMIYMLAWGILSLCAGIVFVFTGLLGGLAGGVSAAVITQSGVTGQEAQQATQAAGQVVAVSFGAILYGIVRVLTGPVMVAVGIGLSQKMRWSRMGVVIAASVAVISGLLGLFTGDTIYGLMGIVVNAFIAYSFYTDAGIKAEFEK